jgi:Sulfotransferase family
LNVDREEILQRVDTFRRAELPALLDPLIADKVEILRQYDVLGMDRAVAICVWGRSGSYLLASYLDGHDQIVMLPFNHSQWIYDFLDASASLSLYEKLIAYPIYVEQYTTRLTPEPFFAGDNPVAAPDYYAAVEALFNVYGNQTAEVLASPRTFFQFLHVAYSVAIGRTAVHPRPVIVFTQHQVKDAVAGRFVEAFPDARFIHTIRDPIANFASSFAAILRWQIDNRPIPHPGYIAPVLGTVVDLAGQDRPNRTTEARSVAVRFEDMHLDPEGTIDRLAHWLDLPHQSSLRDSTFNGLPYVNYSQGKTWVGSRPEQAKRRSPNMSFTDRAIVFALFQEDFAAWNYDAPKRFAHAWVRWLTWLAVLPVPMRTELVAAGVVMQRQVLPFLGQRRFMPAARALFRLVACHISVRRLIRTELSQRIAGRHLTIHLLG